MMEELYQISIDPNVDLHTRYDAVRTMIYLREKEHIDYSRVQADRVKSKKKRIKKAKENEHAISAKASNR